MKVIDERSYPNTSFNMLSYGDTFIYNSQLYLKVDSTQAFNFNTNQLGYFASFVKVASVNASLSVTR